MKTYFTSDLHFTHESMIRFDNRPFTNVDEMDAELIKRWNSRVNKVDTVYVLGDIFWKASQVGSILSQLNGHIVVIKGNHDKWTKRYKNSSQLVIKDYANIKVELEDGTIQRVVLSHYPILLYDGHYHETIMLFGHVHGTKEHQITMDQAKELNSKDVRCKMYPAWCGWYDYTPVTLDEILERWS